MLVAAVCLSLPTGRDGSVALAACEGARCVDGEAEALRERRLAVFDDVWQMVRERYYDAALHGVDWRAAREEFRPLAAGADDQTQLYAVLRRMLARLHDPHTRVFAPDEGFNWREPRLLTVGLSVREIGGELLVVSVVRGSEADATGVRAGDALVSVDGAAAGAMVMRRLEEQNAGLEVASARNIAVARLFEGARDSFAEVVFKSSDAREKRVLLRRTLSARTPTLSMRRVGRGIGVAEFNAFTPEIASELARALRDMRGVDSLVLDLRGNGGGEAEAMTDIASLFLPGGTRLGSFIDRAGRVQSEPQTRRAMLSSAHTVEVFRGSVVVLTGARTASAAEIFVAALKDAGRVRVVGENTCGCVLGIRRRHALLDGGMLDVSEVDFRTARGARLEGTGIAPHETVTPTRRDLYAGRDRVMQRAVEMLKEK